MKIDKDALKNTAKYAWPGAAILCAYTGLLLWRLPYWDWSTNTLIAIGIVGVAFCPIAALSMLRQKR